MKILRNSLLREIRRFGDNRLLVVSSVVIPVVVTVLYVFMFARGTVHNLPVAIYDADGSALSRQLTRMVGATPTARVALHVESIEQGRQAMLEGQAGAVIVIPRGFESTIYSGGQASVAAEISGARILNAGLLKRDITTVLQAFNIGIETQMLGLKGIPAAKGYQMAYPVAFERHILFNPYGSYAYYLLPALLPLLLVIVVITTTVYIVGSELRYGTAAQWVETAGGSITVALTSKLAPYLLLFSIISLFMNTMLYRFMGLPFHADQVALMLTANLFVILSYMSLGIILVALSANMRFALSIGGGYATISMSLCGLTFPFEAMYPWVASLGKIFPFTYYMDVFIEQSMRGAPPARSLGDLAAMGVFILISALFIPRLKKIALDSKYYFKS